jgi:hypothetical protein
MPENDSTLTIPRRVPPMPNLDYVFDDPADGEPGRDRMLVHTVWELVLAAAALVVGYLLFRATSNAFGGAPLRTMLLQASFPRRARGRQRAGAARRRGQPGHRPAAARGGALLRAARRRGPAGGSRQWSASA